METGSSRAIAQPDQPRRSVGSAAYCHQAAVTALTQGRLIQHVDSDVAVETMLRTCSANDSGYSRLAGVLTHSRTVTTACATISAAAVTSAPFPSLGWITVIAPTAPPWPRQC